MIGIGPDISALMGLLFFVALWGGVIYFVVTVVKRLSEISRSLRSIDEKLGKSKPTECPSPHEESAE